MERCRFRLRGDAAVPRVKQALTAVASTPPRRRSERANSGLRFRVKGGVITVGLLCLGTVAVWPASAGATFPGVNGSIAYQGYSAGFTVASVTPDGAIQRQLTASGASPAWSASGSLIAFAAQLPTSQVEIHTMAADGSGRTQLTNLGSAWFPAWSPDDSKIAVASYSTITSNYDIWAVDANGANPTQLTAVPAEDIGPSWSPDGTKIAFQTNRDGDREIYVMDGDGGNPKNLTNRHASEDSSPDWSPDGSKIVFTSTGPNGGGTFVMNADGSDVTPLGPGGEATWSPDGQRIAFTNTSDDGSGTDLFTMKPDGAGVTRLTRDGGEKFMTDWQPLGPGSLTQTALSSPVGTIVYGEDAIFTSTVTSAGPTPTGLMQFRLNGINEGAPIAVGSDGRAEFTPLFLLDVGDVASATYSGSARWGWSTGDAALEILPASTTTELIASRNPVPSGETTEMTVTVVNADTDIPPFGSVQFSVDGVPVGPPLDLDDNGQVAVGLVANVPAGDYRVMADYRDDTAAVADFEPSSASLVQRVTSSTTTSAPTPQIQPPAVVQPAAPAAVRKKDLASFTTLLEQALRKRGFAALRGKGALFSAAAPGTLSQELYVRGRRSAAGRSAVRRTLISAGRHSFKSPGSSRLRLRLTREGKRLIRRAERLDVDVRTRYVPTSGTSAAVTKRVSVTKRGRARARPTRVLRQRDHAWNDTRPIWPSA